MTMKNIEHSKILELKDQVSYLPGQIVSRTLAQNQSVSITLFAFAKGEEISTHESGGDALVTILDGAGCITIEGKEFTLKEGGSILMPANRPHSVSAPDQPFKMMLTVVFPKKTITMDI